ncbi:hypothetical protein ES332_A09G089500v1 [Gossypium tomentosum]|uniref:Lipoxygenase domain-containing protein n=1 Tax=Gossypium tomentosum TaxID=34277 RepID=A0A5D2P524_GOSTO|nr:hypothetical protein ES332_A09G089500v1 [Gossypium tomentosum]
MPPPPPNIFATSTDVHPLYDPVQLLIAPPSLNPLQHSSFGNKTSHEVEFVVDANFGVPGAIIVTNKYKKEFYLESIVAIEGLLVHFACNSWVQPHGFHAHKRIFFSSNLILAILFWIEHVYLPNDTPMGLKRLREKELKQLRGNSDDSRTTSDRIYEYDVYNDLGNPDKGDEFIRPILRSQSKPYPRWCRSKRPPTNSDVNVESPVSKYMLKYVLRDEAVGDLKAKAITEGKWKAMLRSLVPTLKQKVAINGKAIKSFSDITELKGGLPKLLNKMIKEWQDVFKFDSPKLISSDIPSCCLRDDELGLFPPVSNLDPSIYGPQDSALKEEQIIFHLNGMSVQQAIEENKLFVLDYHDVYLPFLDRINAHPTKKAYATRTIFRVVTPPVDATTCWLWQLSKAHVCSNDAGAHQLIHHWLRTQACLEPFIIAAHRQLSGRQLLLNAGGIVESHFFTAACSMEVSASVYQNWWRFDMESLPADLIQRGMAVQDATEPHGLKLLIEDYPYATDGLLILSAIEQLVQAYVHYYYPEANIIESDSELNACWWLKLSTPNNLISILTTIIWLASAHHAAVNFGMYPYDGYFPVRPPFMRRLVPNEHDPDYTTFLADPEGYFLASLPCLDQMLHYISTFQRDPEIVEAFYKFSMEMKKIGKEIEKRNGDPNLRNRCGAGISPYELLLPSSGPGVTCRGVPNSVSI